MVSKGHIRLLARIRKVGVQYMRQHMENKQFSFKSGGPQDAWTPIWLKAWVTCILNHHLQRALEVNVC